MDEQSSAGDSAQPAQQFTVTEAAALINAPAYSVRRWCEYHAIYLSPMANPAAGQARRLTAHDVEVLRMVNTLRAQGLTVSAINERLGEVKIGEVDSTEPVGNSDLAAAMTTGSELAHSAPGYDSALHVRVMMLADQVAEIKQRQRDVWVAFCAGVIVTALFVLLIVLLLRPG